MEEGIIFDIKRYAIHDGPGIRTTVFLKGCPLECWWCHNPEGQKTEPELIFRESKCLEGCTECLAACPKNALSKTGPIVVINRTKCELSKSCIETCPTGALEVAGKKMTVAEIMEAIEKDSVFYDDSKGGVTFSGGEPLMQPDFLGGLLDECAKRHIHTTVDTCGYASAEIFEKIRDKVGLFLYDLKVIDDKKHIETTGESNEIILKNLKELSEKGCAISIRIPVIPGINDSSSDIEEMVEFLNNLQEIEEIDLLPYHKIGSQKYGSLDMPDKMAETPALSDSTVARIKKQLEKHAFSVKIGG